MNENNILTLANNDDMEVRVAVNATANLVTEDEKAIEDALSPAYYAARKLGCFSPAAGMGNLVGVLGDSVFADKFCADNGEIYFRFTQKFSDGSFMTIVQMKQSELLLAASFNFDIERIPIRPIKRRVSRFLESFIMDYMGKVMVDEVKDPLPILQALVKSAASLPCTYSQGGELSREQFYTVLMENISELYGEDVLSYCRHRSYYAFGEDIITTLANKMGFQFQPFIKKMAEYRFLYLTPSSRGYQSKVRISADTEEWCYCILRLDNLDKAKAKVELKPSPQL